MNKYQQQTTSTQPVTPPHTYTEKEFLHTWTAGAFLPFVQSVIAGIVAMIFTAMILYARNAIDYLMPMLLAGGTTFVLMYLVLMRRWLELTAEKITGIDINGDGVIGPKPRSIRVTLNMFDRNQRMSQFYYDFSDVASETQLIEFADGMLNAGRNMAEREWSGPGKPFSIDEYRSFRSFLIGRGLARAANKKGANQGFELTEEGEAVFGKILTDGRVEGEVVE